MLGLSDHNTKNYLNRIIGVICALFLIALSWWQPYFIETFRLKTYDIFLRQQPAPQGTDSSIIIVDIDDRSLSTLGQWPWPRSFLAEILLQIGQGQPKVVALDIVFAEPDRLSPQRVVMALNKHKISPTCRQQLNALPDHDNLLAQALKSTPVVLGFPFTFRYHPPEVNAQHYQRPGRFAVIGSDPTPWLFQASSVVANLAKLEKSAQGSGFFNILPDIDGLVRKVPLVIQYDDEFYPALALEMIRVSGGSHNSISRIHSSSNGLEMIQHGSCSIPVDANGQLSIRYLAKKDTFRYISAVDILAGLISPDVFKDAYILIGTSAPGLLDIVATPISAIVPGVEVHAHALNTILTESYIIKPDWSKGAELCYILFVSVILIILIPVFGALKGSYLFLVSGSGIVLFSYWLFSFRNYYFDPIYPLLCTGSVFLVLSFLNYLQEEKRRRQVKYAFAKYMSPVLVDELMKKPEDLNLTGEDRIITAIFSDIRDYSTIAETLSPQEVCTSLNQYFTVMIKILMNQQAFVDKYIGDAVFAFWNAPLTNVNHARHALLAALEMRDGLKILNNNWQVKNLPAIQAGIAINTGSVRVGNIGSEERLNYTATGDATNLTARLESITKKYGIVIIVNSPTYDMVDHEEFIFCKLDHIRVSGRRKPVTIYELVDKKSRISASQLELLKLRERGLAAYFAGDFKVAQQIFQQLPAGTYDRLQQVFIKRCQDYIETPPGADWDGIHSFTSK